MMCGTDCKYQSMIDLCFSGLVIWREKEATQPASLMGQFAVIHELLTDFVKDDSLRGLVVSESNSTSAPIMT
jgi:hypothetical protein